MKKFALAPAPLTLLLIGLGLELAFAHNFLLNVFLGGLCLLYLLSQRIDLKKFSLIILLSLPLALGTWWSFLKFSQTNASANAALYTSRLFCYLLLGCCLLLTTELETILFSLGVHFKLPPTFIYGFLAAANLTSALQKQLCLIRYAAWTKRSAYHFYRPALYLKLIVTSTKWADALAQAMQTQGFLEGYPRTMSFKEPLALWQWLLPAFLILSYGYVAFGG